MDLGMQMWCKNRGACKFGWHYWWWWWSVDDLRTIYFRSCDCILIVKRTGENSSRECSLMNSFFEINHLPDAIWIWRETRPHGRKCAGGVLTSKRIRRAFVLQHLICSSAAGEKNTRGKIGEGNPLLPSSRWRPCDTLGIPSPSELCKSACGRRSNYNAAHVQDRRLPSYPAFTYVHP